MNITRTLTGILLAGAASLSSGQVLAAPFIVTTNLPPTHWASSQGGEPFMACVTEATKGAVEFNYFPSGQIANFFESLDAVNNGLAQISYIVLTAQTDKLPLANITLLPGLGADAVGLTKATRATYDGDGPIAQEFAANRIVPLMINVFPPYQMLSTKVALDSVAAIQGKKIATGGGSLNVTLAKTGASSAEMAAADLYLALQQGAMDGTMLSIASVKPYNLQEVIKHISANANFGTASGVWSMDAGVWGALPEDQKTAFRDCGLKVETALAAYADNLVTELKTEFTGLGINVFDYSPDALAELDVRLDEARQDYLTRLTSRGLPAQEALDGFVAALGQ